MFIQLDFSLVYIYIYIYVQRTVLIQKKWIPEPIFAAYWRMLVGSGQPCGSSLHAMNLSIHGAVILARDFSVRWGKANSSPGIHDGNMIPAQTRCKKRLGFISPDHAAPDSLDLLPRPRGGTARWDRGDRKKRDSKTVRERRGGEVWWDKKWETKREMKPRTKREKRIIEGRRRLPEDYTSRRLQFTPFGKLDIHRPTPLPPPSIAPSSPSPTVDEWNTPLPEFQTALQIESGSLWIFRRGRRREGVGENETGEVLRRRRWCVCTFERQGWFKRLATNGD